MEVLHCLQVSLVLLSKLDLTLQFHHHAIQLVGGGGERERERDKVSSHSGTKGTLIREKGSIQEKGTI